MPEKQVATRSDLLYDSGQYFITRFCIEVDGNVPAEHKIKNVREVVCFVVQVEYAQLNFAFDLMTSELKRSMSFVVNRCEIFFLKTLRKIFQLTRENTFRGFLQ